MAEGGAEVGVAYVTLAISGQGVVSGLQSAVASAVPALTATSGAAGTSMGKSLLGGFGAAVGPVAVAAAGAGIVKGLYEIGQRFEEMRHIIIKGTGASGEALKGLEQTAKNIASNTSANFTDVGTAVADLNTRLGLTGKPLEELSLKFLRLSKVTGTDVGQNIRDITRLFGDWSIASEDQALAMDKLLVASQATGIGINELSQLVVQFGAPLRQMGFSFEEAVAMFGKFEKEGVNISTVLSGLRMGLKNFAKAGEEPVDALKRAMEAIKGAASTAEANTIAFQVFGARAGPDMAAAIREGRFEFDDLVAAMKGAGGAIEDTHKRTRTFGDVMAEFKNKVLVKLEPLATSLLSSLTKGASFLLDVVGPAVSGLLTVLSPVLKVVVPLAAAFGAWMLALKAYHGAIGLVQMATKAWTAVQMAFNVVMAANPIALVVLALAALAAGIVYAWKHSESFRNAIKALWEVLKGLFSAFRAGLGIVKDAIVGAFRAIGGFFGKAGEAISGFVGDVVSWFAALPGKILGALGDLGGLLVDAGKDVVDGLWRGMKWLWDTSVKVWLAIGTKIKEAVGNLGDILYDAGKDVVDGLWRGMKWVWNTSVKAWLAIGTKIREAVGDLSDILYNAGKAVVDGLWRGMKWVWDKVVWWWDHSVGWLVDKIGGFLGIGSPSKVMYAMGVDFLEGFELGMRAQLPRILKTATGFRSAIEAAVPAGIEGRMAVTPSRIGGLATAAAPAYPAGGIAVYGPITVVAPDPRTFMRELEREVTLNARSRGGR